VVARAVTCGVHGWTGWSNETCPYCTKTLLCSGCQRNVQLQLVQEQTRDGRRMTWKLADEQDQEHEVLNERLLGVIEPTAVMGRCKRMQAVVSRKGRQPVVPEPEEGKAPLHQRVWDLLRQQRHDLMDAELISRQEYAFLAGEAPYMTDGDPDQPGQGSPAVLRLERYDQQDARLAFMVNKIRQAVECCEICRTGDVKKPVCTTCKRLLVILSWRAE